MNCSRCGFPLPPYVVSESGRPAYHLPSECLALLVGEVASLRSAVAFFAGGLTGHRYCDPAQCGTRKMLESDAVRRAVAAQGCSVAEPAGKGAES